MWEAFHKKKKKKKSNTQCSLQLYRSRYLALLIKPECICSNNNDSHLAIIFVLYSTPDSVLKYFA